MVDEPVVFKGSSPKPPFDIEGVSAMIGVPENVVRLWVGVMAADEAAVVSYFLLRLLLAKAMKIKRLKANKAMTPTVIEEMVAMPKVDADSRTDLA